MFESVLEHGKGPRSRIGLGVVFSLVMHFGVLLLVVWISSRSPREQEQAFLVTIQQGLEPPMAAPPLPPPSSTRKKTPARNPVAKKSDGLARPRQHPKEQPPEVKPAPTAQEEEAKAEEKEQEASTEGSGGVAGGVAGGTPSGEIGGVVGEVIGGALHGEVGGTGTGVPSFGSGMTRPRKLSGPKPQYTREALAAHVEGLMIVKCIITTEGKVERCRIIKPLPHMEQAVLKTLYASHYQPVTLQGRPIQVDYTFNIRLTLPP